MNTSAFELAQRIQTIEPSATLAILAQAEALKAAGKPIINLSVGEPEFNTPQHIKAAAIQAIHDNHTKYTVVDGIPCLKQAIIDKLIRENHLNYRESQILVSCGAKHSLYNALVALINPLDEVIIPAPYWVSYPPMVKLAEGIPVIVATNAKTRFKISPSQLENAITAKTRALILNSPSNPTGMAYNEHELRQLAAVLEHYPNILILSDDIYEHHLWTANPFVNILNVCPELYERTLVINGVSKAYAMTGFRIGYAAGPAHIIRAMKKIQSHSTSNPTSISQYAAYAALSGDQECVRQMAASYQRRHDYFVPALQSIPGIHCFPSDGTFYTFPNVEALYTKNISNDLQFSEYLLNTAGLAVVPGSSFGAPHHIRLCYTMNESILKEAIERFKAAVK